MYHPPVKISALAEGKRQWLSVMTDRFNEIAASRNQGIPVEHLTQELVFDLTHPPDFPVELSPVGEFFYICATVVSLFCVYVVTLAMPLWNIRMGLPDALSRGKVIEVWEIVDDLQLVTTTLLAFLRTSLLFNILGAVASRFEFRKYGFGLVFSTCMLIFHTIFSFSIQRFCLTIRHLVRPRPYP